MSVTPPAKRVAAALALLVVACGGSAPDTAPSPSPAPTPAPIPSPVPAPAPAPPPALVTLRGMVIDEQGAPMPNAFVAIMRNPNAAGPSTYSDANGTFAIGGIDPGLKTVEARQWRYQTVDREVNVDGVTSVSFAMQLLPQVTFTGVVSDADSGALIPGAVITFLDSPGARDNAGLSAVSDSAGRYRFEKVYTANSNLSATAHGYQEWRSGLHVFGDTVLDFQLRRVQSPQTFTGTIGGPPETWTCTTKVTIGRGVLGDAPCKDLPFTTRRTGSADLTLTWTGSATMQLQLLSSRGFPEGPPPTSGTGNRIDLQASYLAAGDHVIRVINAQPGFLPRLSQSPSRIATDR